MTFFIIPNNNPLPNFKFKSTLSGTVFTLSFRYNTRSNRWVLDISDSAGNQILSGIPLLIERDVLSQYPTLSTPIGPILVFDNSGKGLEATLNSFQLDHTLYYGDPTQ